LEAHISPAMALLAAIAPRPPASIPAKKPPTACAFVLPKWISLGVRASFGVSARPRRLDGCDSYVPVTVLCLGPASAVIGRVFLIATAT
jgi:hypothetical protein